MQIVIDISDKKYKSICDHFMFMHENEVMFAVKEGIPLPKFLDKITAEIVEKYSDCDICMLDEDDDYGEYDISEYRAVGDITDIIDIIDKYKESEVPDADCD
jgi:hypothetical protein